MSTIGMCVIAYFAYYLLNITLSESFIQTFLLLVVIKYSYP
jgi:hypothetical protein